ncbi:MAG: flavodoxin [Herbinix sp.]|jgi:menaquinone-dependent protoporphyrinogen IX oxidase|nr:flavodoxin [Herbinix sp.]
MSENKKIVVVYRSKSGFAKNYAIWLSEKLKCDLLEGTKAKAKDLLSYDTIIYGAGLYAIGINGIKLITKNYDLLKNKKLIVYAVGASPSRSETTEEVRKANIPAEQLDKIKFFYLRGGFDYSRLTFFNKILMTLMKIKLKNTKNPDADAKGMLASYDHPLDFTNVKYIEPILKFIGIGE